MGQFISKTRNGMIVFNVDVNVPQEQAGAFAEAMTGNDDDIVLAAERAIRDRLSDVDVRYDLTDEEVELGVPDESDVKHALEHYARG